MFQQTGVWNSDKLPELPALKRIIGAEGSPGALKRSFPRMNAGASTRCSLFRLLTKSPTH
jgi:hypothetical protein